MPRVSLSLFVVCCLLLTTAVRVPAQSGLGKVVRPNAVIHTVANLDRSVAFYRDLVGLPLERDARWLDGSARENGMLVNAPGAAVRSATFSIPGTEVRLVLVEFSGVEATPVVARIQDPGVVKLVLRVRDIDKAFAAVQKQLTGVYTDGGGPVRPEGPNGVNRAVITKDPDGAALEFVYQTVPPLPDSLPATTNVVGGWASLVVEDLATTIDFYKQQMGFAINGTGRPAAPGLLTLEGTLGAVGTRSTGSRPPGAAYTWFLYDFRDIDRRTLDARMQDPGNASVSFIVENLNDLLLPMTSLNIRVETVGGVPLDIANQRRVVIRDPSGILIELVQPLAAH